MAPKRTRGSKTEKSASTEGNCAAGGKRQAVSLRPEEASPEKAATQTVPPGETTALPVNALERGQAVPECHRETGATPATQQEPTGGGVRDDDEHQTVESQTAQEAWKLHESQGLGQEEDLDEGAWGNCAGEEETRPERADDVELDDASGAQAVAPPCIRILQALHLRRENRAVHAIAAAAVLMRPAFGLLLDLVKQEHEKQKEEEKVRELEQTRLELMVPRKKGKRAHGRSLFGGKGKLGEEMNKTETVEQTAAYENGEDSGSQPGTAEVLIDEVGSIDGQLAAREERRLNDRREKAGKGTKRERSRSRTDTGDPGSRSQRPRRSGSEGAPSTGDGTVGCSSTVQATGTAEDARAETPDTQLCEKTHGGSCHARVADERSKGKQQASRGSPASRQGELSSAVIRLSQKLVGGVDRWFVKTEAERVGLSKVQSAMQWLEEKFLRDGSFEGEEEKGTILCGMQVVSPAVSCAAGSFESIFLCARWFSFLCATVADPAPYG